MASKGGKPSLGARLRDRERFRKDLGKVDEHRLNAEISDIAARKTKGEYGRKLSKGRADNEMKKAREELNRNTGPLSYENLKKLEKAKLRLDKYEVKRSKPRTKTERSPSGHKKTQGRGR